MSREVARELLGPTTILHKRRFKMTLESPVPLVYHLLQSSRLEQRRFRYEHPLVSQQRNEIVTATKRKQLGICHSYCGGRSSMRDHRKRIAVERARRRRKRTYVDIESARLPDSKTNHHSKQVSTRNESRKKRERD